MSSSYEDIGLNDQLMAIDGISGREDTSLSAAELRNDVEGGGLSARNIGYNYNMNTYGYAENFDSSFDFVLPFYIDQSVIKIQKVLLNLLFSKYRGFTKASAGESSHTHGITGKTTAGGGDHNHGNISSSGGHTHSTNISVVSPVGGGDVAVYVTPNTCGSFIASSSSTVGGFTSSEASHTHTITGSGDHTHDITGIATDAGSSHSHAMSYGIYEDSYASNVSITVVSGGGTADVTTAIGGPFNPSSGTPNFYDLDITKYVKGTGLNTINISTDTNGRLFPVLWVKTVIGG